MNLGSSRALASFLPFPIPFHCARRDTQHDRRLFDRQSAEKAQLDELGQLFVDGREVGQRIIERNQVQISLLVCDSDRLVEAR